MNRIAAGALSGLVLGLIVGGYLARDWGAVLVPALLTAVLGAVTGVVAERGRSALATFLAGALFGALTYWFIGRGSGATKTALALGALVGMDIAAVVNFRGTAPRP
jgi:hypothetical protein